MTGQSKRKRPIIGIAALLLTLGITAHVNAQTASAALSGADSKPLPASAVPVPTGDAGAPEDYRLDTGDGVAIEVARHTDVSRAFRLTSDAKIRLPRLSSPILARGKTCAELTAEITERLTKEGKLKLRPNQVLVQVTDMRVRRIYVRGSAGRSSDYDLKNGWRISELLTILGGVPNPERVTARLLNPKRPEEKKVDLFTALNSPESADNIALQEGDTLIMDLPRNKRLLVKGEGPRGIHELDERFGLRQALVSLGFATSNASGDLRHARLLRPSIPGDPNAPTTTQTVDLFALLSDDTTPDIALHDMDTLEIPISERFIYIYGESAAPRKWYMPEDRKVYLADVMAMGYTGSTKLDGIKVMRVVDNKANVKTYKFGTFLKNGDPQNNPEIQPKDMIVMDYVTRSDERINSVWQVWGLYNLAAAVFPGVRLR